MKQMITVKEFAEALNISRATVYRMIDNQKLNHVRVSDRCIRIPKSELDTRTNNKPSAGA